MRKNPKTLNPKTGFLLFFIAVLSPGRCLDGFVPHFSCRYTPSDPNFIILDPKNIKFRDLRRGMNSVNFCGRASSQLARIATISGRPAKSRKKVVENICVFLSKVDRASFSLSTGASRPSPTPHTAHQKKNGCEIRRGPRALKYGK